MTEPERAKRALRDLADAGEDLRWREHVDRASDAIDDLEAAAAYLDEVGLDSLQRAIERADRNGDDDRRDRGRAALERFEEFRAVAEGDYLQSGHGTTLTADGVGERKR